MDDFEAEFSCMCSDVRSVIDRWRVKAESYEREEAWVAAIVTRTHLKVLRRLLAGEDDIFDDPRTAHLTSLQIANAQAWGNN